jgi:hypothetical protein
MTLGGWEEEDQIQVNQGGMKESSRGEWKA